MPSSLNSTNPTYRPDIDGLRALAMLAVIGFHAFPFHVPGGFIGVDVFFVISGYLISGIIFSGLEDGSFHFSDFYARRIRRIFPALLIVLIASFAFGWFYPMLADEFRELGKQIATSAGFAANFVFWQEAGYFDHAANTKPLLHLWSLGVEEQFYIVWPPMLWLIHRLKLDFLFVTLTIMGASFLVNVMTVGDNNIGAFYSPLARFWELLSGGILAYAASRKSPLASEMDAATADCLASIGLFLTGFSIIVMNRELEFPGWWAIMPVTGAICLLAAGQKAWINRAVLSNRVLVGIGLISYPLYLWHWPLLVFAQMVNGEKSSPLLRCGILAASFLLAWITYRLVEKPVRYGPHNLIKVSALCILMALTGLAGFATYEEGGFDFRYPEIIRRATHVNENYNEEWRAGKCFLPTRQDQASAFAAECLPPQKPLVFLWGDSFAASLYPGLRDAAARRNFGIAQYTASACPPLMNFTSPSRPHCRSINDFILRQIEKSKPDIVLLHAGWQDIAYDPSKLGDTIIALRKIGIARIIVLGPLPEWRDTLAHDIFDSWRKTRADPPLRMGFGLMDTSAANDQKMSEISKKLGVEYISAYRALCNQDGCLTRTGENSTDIISFDYGHLTPEAAGFLISQIDRQLFKAP